MLNQQVTKYKRQTNITPLMDKIQKRIRLLHIYLSQLENLISESTDQVYSFYEHLGDTDKIHRHGSDGAKSRLLEIHQMCEKQVSDFTKQSDIIMKFAPDTGTYINEHIKSVKELISDFEKTINTQIDKNQTESFHTAQSAEFTELLLEMNQEFGTIDMLITAVNNVSDSTLEFIEGI